jgi:hypothetical protein
MRFASLQQSRSVAVICAARRRLPMASFCASIARMVHETREHLNACCSAFSTIGAESDQWADGVVARVPWQLRQCMVTLGRAVVGGLWSAVDSTLASRRCSTVWWCRRTTSSRSSPTPRVAARERVRSARADVASLGAIQRSVQRQATALPRIFHAARVNDAALLASLRLVRGYVELLPHDANALLFCASVSPDGAGDGRAARDRHAVGCDERASTDGGLAGRARAGARRRAMLQ